MPGSLSFVFVVLLLTNCHFINGAPLQNPAPNALSSTNTPQSVDPLSSTASSKSKGSGTDPSASLFTTDASGLGGVMPTSSSPDGLDSKSLDVMGPTKTGDAAGSLQYGPGSPALDVGSPRSYGDDGLVSENSGSGSEIDTSNIDVSSLLVVVKKLTSILLDLTGTSDHDSLSPYGSENADEDPFKGSDSILDSSWKSSTDLEGSKAGIPTDDGLEASGGLSGTPKGMSGKQGKESALESVSNNKSMGPGQDQSLGSENSLDTTLLSNTDGDTGSSSTSNSQAKGKPSSGARSLENENPGTDAPASSRGSIKLTGSSTTKGATIEDE